jgi:hypothetical protein
MVYLKILPTTFTSIVYAIGDPLVSYSLPAFSLNYPAYASNPRFTILYELIEAFTGLAPALPITNTLLNLDNTLRSFDIYSDDFGMSIGTTNLIWRAKFDSYNPTYMVDVPFSLTLTTACADNPISNLNSPGTMYHLIEDPTQTVGTWSLWTEKRPPCVISFTYSCSPSMPEVTTDWAAPSITVTATPGTTAPGLV